MRFISEFIGFGVTLTLLIIGVKTVVSKLGQWARAYNEQNRDENTRH